jgi:hypothetical protein
VRITEYLKQKGRRFFEKTIKILIISNLNQVYLVLNLKNKSKKYHKIQENNFLNTKIKVGKLGKAIF